MREDWKERELSSKKKFKQWEQVFLATCRNKISRREKISSELRTSSLVSWYSFGVWEYMEGRFGFQQAERAMRCMRMIHIKDDVHFVTEVDSITEKIIKIHFYEGWTKWNKSKTKKFSCINLYRSDHFHISIFEGVLDQSSLRRY